MMSDGGTPSGKPGADGGLADEQPRDWKQNGEPMWLPAAALFGAGDILTTVMGFSVGATEANPLPARILGHAAASVTPGTVITLLVLKILTFAVFACMWALFPVGRFGLSNRWRATIPAALTAVGGAVVVYNSFVIHSLAF